MSVVILMALVLPLIMWWLFPGMKQGRGEWTSPAQRFASTRFAHVWDDPQERDLLAATVAREFEVHVELLAPDGSKLLEQGPACHGKLHTVPVKEDGRHLGQLGLCLSRSAGHAPWVLGLLGLLGLLWKISGAISRRVSQPLSELAAVARSIGRGQLDSRSALSGHRLVEVRHLARTINDMAARVQKQLNDQRELLAAVSHELRSPLTRMRVAVELAAERQQADPQLIQSLQEEITTSDRLVGDMLASARLEFHGLERSPLSLKRWVTHVLNRRQLPLELVQAQADPWVNGDPTLLARALENLLDNAQHHGGGVQMIRIYERGASACLDVEDSGPGFPVDALPHVFESFYRSAAGGVQGLGLGLALVQRIAHAHGGRAHAANLATGRGACVGLCLPSCPQTHAPTAASASPTDTR